MSEMVERVARAIAKDEGWDLPHDMTLPYAPGSRIGKAMSQARAAIAEMREPTEVMEIAGGDALSQNGVDSIHEDDAPMCWRAMIEAALEEKT